jgi:glycosyltransferase involved in cell wall biosynthesis
MAGSRSEKRRIFYYSWIAPVEGSGATLAMKRHFVDNRDFDLFVASSNLFEEKGILSLYTQRPRWLQRLSNTRFVRAVRHFEMLFHSRQLPPNVLEAARKFRPDAVFTVADLAMSEQARRLAEILHVPLIVNFQDWWPQGQFYYPFEQPYRWAVPILERRFRRLYRKASLAFCTSEGMKEFLGPHPNAHVLYPIGAKPNELTVGQTNPSTIRAIRKNNSRQRLVYTGTAFGGYGRMLRGLVRELEKQKDWELVIYGNTPDWPKDELEQAKERGLYRGLLKFDQLQVELRDADACLAVMSFEPALSLMMRTSFTTKVLDYCQAGSPLVLWGPEYSPPVRLARKNDAALIVDNPDPIKVIEALQRLQNEPGLADRLSGAAYAMGSHDLDHVNIHSIFTREVNRLWQT